MVTPLADGDTVTIRELIAGRAIDVKIVEMLPGYFVALTPCCSAATSVDEHGDTYCKKCYGDADPIHNGPIEPRDIIAKEVTQ